MWNSDSFSNVCCLRTDTITSSIVLLNSKQFSINMLYFVYQHLQTVRFAVVFYNNNNPPRYTIHDVRTIRSNIGNITDVTVETSIIIDISQIVLCTHDFEYVTRIKPYLSALTLLNTVLNNQPIYTVFDITNDYAIVLQNKTLHDIVTHTMRDKIRDQYFYKGFFNHQLVYAKKTDHDDIILERTLTRDVLIPAFTNAYAFIGDITDDGNLALQLSDISNVPRKEESFYETVVNRVLNVLHENPIRANSKQAFYAFRQLTFLVYNLQQLHGNGKIHTKTFALKKEEEEEEENEEYIKVKNWLIPSNEPLQIILSQLRHAVNESLCRGLGIQFFSSQ